MSRFERTASGPGPFQTSADIISKSINLKAQQALSQKELESRERMSKDQRMIDKQKLMEIKRSNLALEEYQKRIADIQKRQADIEGRKVDIAEREIPISQQDFAPSLVLRFKGMMAMRGGPAVAKSFERAMKIIEGWADDPQVTKGIAFDNAMAHKDTLYATVIEDAKKEYDRVIKNDPMGQGKESQSLLQIIDRLSQDKEGVFIAQMFPGVVSERQQVFQEIAAKKKETPFSQTREGVILKSELELRKKESKELKDLATRFQQSWNKAASIESGQDIMSEAMGEQKEKVSQQEYQRAINIAIEYTKKGGNPGDLGFETMEKEGQLFIKTGQDTWTRVK